MNVLPSLSEAPALKTMPSEISEIKKDLAQQGSHILEIDGQVSKTTADLQQIHQSLNSIPNTTIEQQELALNQAVLDKLSHYWNQKLTNETSKLGGKLDESNDKFKILATNLTEQLQKQELHSKKAWVSFYS